MPVLLIVGLEDSLYPFEVHQMMQEQIPNAELEILLQDFHSWMLSRYRLTSERD